MPVPAIRSAEIEHIGDAVLASDDDEASDGEDETKSSGEAWFFLEEINSDIIEDSTDEAPHKRGEEAFVDSRLSDVIGGCAHRACAEGWDSEADITNRFCANDVA